MEKDWGEVRCDVVPENLGRAREARSWIPLWNLFLGTDQVMDGSSQWEENDVVYDRFIFIVHIQFPILCLIFYGSSETLKPPQPYVALAPA